MARRRFKKNTPAQLNDVYYDLQESRRELQEKQPKYDPGEYKDKTRSRIALIFVCGYIALIGLVFFFVLLFNLILILTNKQPSSLLEAKDVILVVTSALGSSVGFVVGYYFKGEENKAG